MDQASIAIKGGRGSFFKNPEVDQLLAMVLTLMSEHSVLRERVMTLENMLEEAGVLPVTSVEQFVPDEETRTGWDDERMRLIRAVLEAGSNIDGRSRHPEEDS